VLDSVRDADLAAALHQLFADHRAVVALVDIDGLTYRKPQTCSRSHRARS
jgi:DNA-directed RNA polymerase specialized sigma24 family protein